MSVGSRNPSGRMIWVASSLGVGVLVLGGLALYLGGASDPTPAASTGSRRASIPHTLIGSQVAGASGISIDARTGHAFVVNAGSNSVTMLAPASNAPIRAVRTIPVGTEPIAVAADAQTGHVLVLNGLSSSVSMVDARTGLVLRTVPVGVLPRSIALDGPAHRAFVAFGTTKSSGVTVLDTATGRVLRTNRLALTPNLSVIPNALGVDTRAGRVFVTGQNVSTLRVLDAATGQLLPGSTVGYNSTVMGIDQGTHHLFVVNPNSRVGAVGMYDSRTGAIVATAGASPGVIHVGMTPDAVAVDERTQRVFVANRDDNTVSVVNSLTGTVVRVTTVGAEPVALAINERAGRVFVANGGGDSVSELDATSGQLVRTVAAGNTPLDIAVDQHTGRVFVVDLMADSGPAQPPPPNRWDRLQSAVRRLFGGYSQQSPVSTTAASNGAVSMLYMPT